MTKNCVIVAVHRLHFNQKYCETTKIRPDKNRQKLKTCTAQPPPKRSYHKQLTACSKHMLLSVIKTRTHTHTHKFNCAQKRILLSVIFQSSRITQQKTQQQATIILGIAQRKGIDVAPQNRHNYTYIQLVTYLRKKRIVVLHTNKPKKRSRKIYFLLLFCVVLLRHV